MAQPTPVPVPLEQTRERIIQQLCEHFACDNLTAEALEERLDLAHRAATLDDLRSLVSDLPVVHQDAVYTGGGGYGGTVYSFSLATGARLGGRWSDGGGYNLLR